MHRGFGEAGEEIVERGISSRLEGKKMKEGKKRKVSGWVGVEWSEDLPCNRNLVGQSPKGGEECS